VSLKPFEVAGQLYDGEAIDSLRENIIILRDSALKNDDMQWAVILSHTVGVLAKVKEELDGPQ
jgi:hypothetical protein